MENKARKGIVVLGAISLYCLIVKLIVDHNDNILTKQGRKATAHVTSVGMGIKPTLPKISFYYVVGTDTITSSTLVQSIVNFDKLKSLKGQKMEVIYDTIHIKRNKLIIDEDKYR
jgi:hypothetical protein